MQRNQNRLMILLAVLGVAGCGSVEAPQAERQVVTPIPVPPAAASDEHPFMLAGESESVTYGGSVLFWDAGVTKEQIAAVAKASVEGRLQKAGNLNFINGELAAAKQQLNEVSAVRQELTGRVAKVKAEGGRLAAALRPSVGAWFENRLKELKLSGDVDAADVAHARTHFEAYCEYKVWELATNPVLENKFESRPTPLQMCEPYYARAGLLKADAGLCKETGNRRDFFGCLWQQGVLETKVFKGKLDTATCDAPGLTRAAAITSWIAMPEFRAALFDGELADGIQSYGTLLNEAILSRGTIPSELRDKYPFFKDCKKAFKNDLVLPDQPNWEYASLLDLKTIVEGTGDGTEVYSLLPKTGDATRDHARHEMLAKSITAFGQRNVTEAAVNDQIFNQNAQSTVRAGAYFFELYQKAPEFAAVRAAEANAVPEELRAEVARLDADHQAAVARVDAANATKTSRDGDLIGKTFAGVKAVMAPGATTLFMPLVFKVTKTAAALDVVITLGEPGKPGVHGMAGCAPIAPATSCWPVPSNLPALHKGFDFAAYDLSSGQLTLDVMLNDLAAIGLGHDPQTGTATSYNNLTQEALLNRVLRFEAVANKVDGALRIVTGKALIVDPLDRDGPVLHEGSFSADDYAAQTGGQR
jgi:hypothetical protein